MLISENDEPFDSPDWLFEVKLDGERALAYLDKTGTVLVNRRERRIFPQFPELAELGPHVGRRCILDGELIIGSGRKPDFELIKERSLSKSPYRIKRLSQEKPATFVALDILYLDGNQLTGRPLEERKKLLAEILEENDFLVKSRTFPQYGKRLFEQVVERGLEGIIAKKLDSVYLMGKRTRDWVKIKHWLQDNFIVCGYFSSDTTAVASLVLGQYTEKEMLRYSGRVMIGLRRDEFEQIQKLSKSKRHPFAVEPDIGVKSAITWVRPLLVCSVGFMCRFRDNMLRQPFFKNLHHDIDPQSVIEPESDPTTSCVSG